MEHLKGLLDQTKPAGFPIHRGPDELHPGRQMNIPILPCQMQTPPASEPEGIGFELKPLENSLQVLVEDLIAAWKAGHLSRTSFLRDWKIKHDRGNQNAFPGDWSITYSPDRHVVILSRYVSGEMASIRIELRC